MSLILITCTASFVRILVTEVHWSILQCTSVARLGWKIVLWCVLQFAHFRHIVSVLIEIIKTQHFWIKLLGGNNVLNMPELLCLPLLVHAVEHHVLFSECGICWVYVALQVGPIMVGKESQRGLVWLLHMDWRIQLHSFLFDWLKYYIYELLLCMYSEHLNFFGNCADVFKSWYVAKHHRDFSKRMFKPTITFLLLFR